MNVSIVLYNTLYSEIQSLVEIMTPIPQIETIFLIDNSPSQNTILKDVSGKVKYVFNNANIGFGAAHNIAMKESINNNIKYHLVINPDISFKGDILKEILLFMDENADVGLLMPKVFYPNGNIQYLCKLLPTPFDWIGRRFFPFPKVITKRNKLFELHDSGYDKIMNIPYLSGCFMFLRIETLNKIGLFDEKIFMYGEDTDITRRIHQFYKTLFYPKVTIIHHHNKESYRSRRLLWIHIKSAIYYFNKWGWIFDQERRKFNKRVIEDYII